MANWWFGARWFGIQGVPLSDNSGESQESKPPQTTINRTISWGYMSSEKRPPGYLGYIGDEILQQLYVWVL